MTENNKYNLKDYTNYKLIFFNKIFNGSLIFFVLLILFIIFFPELQNKTIFTIPFIFILIVLFIWLLSILTSSNKVLIDTDKKELIIIKNLLFFFEKKDIIKIQEIYYIDKLIINIANPNEEIFLDFKNNRGDIILNINWNYIINHNNFFDELNKINNNILYYGIDEKI